MFVFGRRLREFSLPEIALALACIPILIGPPLAAVVIVGIKILQDNSRYSLAEWRRPLFIALINIAFSILFWRYALGELGTVFLPIVEWIGGTFPSPSPPAGDGPGTLGV